MSVGGDFNCSENKLSSLVDVKGNVNLSNKGLGEIGIRFGVVTGRFNCNRNKLTSLVNGPIKVEGDFNCGNNGMVSLLGSFSCSNNELTTLEGCPIVSGYFDCNDNNLSEAELFIYDYSSMKTTDSMNNYNYHQLQQDNLPNSTTY